MSWFVLYPILDLIVGFAGVVVALAVLFRYIAAKEILPFPLYSDKSLRPHKWDLRCFVLIASYKPLVLYVNQGYIHKSLDPYNATSTSRYAHITNP